MIDEMSDFDRSKSLYLFEGEKDAIRSSLQGVSFSCGATSIPKNIDALYEFKEIIIIYDNDEAGNQGAKKVAERIKSESPTTKRGAFKSESTEDDRDGLQQLQAQAIGAHFLTRPRS